MRSGSSLAFQRMSRDTSFSGQCTCTLHYLSAAGVNSFKSRRLRARGLHASQAKRRWLRASSWPAPPPLNSEFSGMYPRLIQGGGGACAVNWTRCRCLAARHTLPRGGGRTGKSVQYLGGGCKADPGRRRVAGMYGEPYCCPDEQTSGCVLAATLDQCPVWTCVLDVCPALAERNKEGKKAQGRTAHGGAEGGEVSAGGLAGKLLAQVHARTYLLRPSGHSCLGQPTICEPC
eukprot:gene7583-biopygen18058